MLYPNEQTCCIHCGRRVRYVDGALGGAWQHIDTISIYCSEDADRRAEPGDTAAPTPPYMDYTIRYDRERLWWLVERADDGALILSGPTSGSVVEDAKAIQSRMERQVAPR